MCAVHRRWLQGAFDEAESMSDPQSANRGTPSDALTRPGSSFQDRLKNLRTYRADRSSVLLVGIWMLGLLTLGAVFNFEGRADETRRAQVVIAQMRNEQGALLAVAFSPAITPTAPRPQETARQLAQAKIAYSASLEALAAIGHSDEPARISATSSRYFAFIDHLSALVQRRASTPAALQLGASERPGGIQFRLAAEFDRADVGYRADATRSREVASAATVLAILLLLLVVSIAFHNLHRARKRSHTDATTDALTGLGNRRKLFADMEQPSAALNREETLRWRSSTSMASRPTTTPSGIPQGDALLARLGSKLAGAVADGGKAYRIGGDEFVVTTNARRRALGPGRPVCAERKRTRFLGRLLDAARPVCRPTSHSRMLSMPPTSSSTRTSAPPRRGDDRRQGRAPPGARGAERGLGDPSRPRRSIWPSRQPSAWASLRPGGLTRLAAELHDIGKSAMPASILEKAGP